MHCRGRDASRFRDVQCSVCAEGCSAGAESRGEEGPARVRGGGRDRNPADKRRYLRVERIIDGRADRLHHDRCYQLSFVFSWNIFRGKL